MTIWDGRGRGNTGMGAAGSVWHLRRRIGLGERVRRVCVFAAMALSWCSCAYAAEPRVLLMRGWFGVFSTGLDTIADELKAKGINAQVVGHLYWTTALAEIEKARASGDTRPIVLVGHSQGANNVIDIARALDAKKIPVDLVVTLAPFLQNPIPANVARAVNFYQTPGWGAPLSGDRGFHGEIANVNLSDDLTIFHVSMDKSEKVQSQIVHEIEAVAQKK
jgi:hypothetical protein